MLDDGHTGAALRAHRSVHVLYATGESRRLAKMIPDYVTDNGVSIEVPFRVGQFLASPLLRFSDDALAVPWYRYVVEPERMGDAVDETPVDILGDEPRSLSVLRAQLLSAGGTRVAAGRDTAYRTALADLYEAATAFPTSARCHRRVRLDRPRDVRRARRRGGGGGCRWRTRDVRGRPLRPRLAPGGQQHGAARVSHLAIGRRC